MSGTTNAGNAYPARRRIRRSRRSVQTRLANWFVAILRTGRLPAFLIAVGAGIVLYGFLASPDYAVETIVVEGADIGDPSEIAEMSDAAGVSVFRVDPDRVARRVAGLPYVERVETEVSVPPSLTIRVTERRPVIAWRTADGLLLIDEHGNVLAETGSSSLPQVAGQGNTLSPGDRIPAERVAAVRAIQNSLGSDAGTITWTRADGLVVERRDGRTVIFGDAGEFALKMAVYERVASDLDTSWSVLDIREPDRPYWQ